MSNGSEIISFCFSLHFASHCISRFKSNSWNDFVTKTNRSCFRETESLPRYLKHRIHLIFMDFLNDHRIRPLCFQSIEKSQENCKYDRNIFLLLNQCLGKHSKPEASYWINNCCYICIKCRLRKMILKK